MAIVVADRNSSSMSGDDRAADRQTQPQTIWLGGSERFEGAVQHVRREARTRVGHKDLNVPIPVESGFDGHPPLVCGQIGHCVASVHDQVDQHLLELNAVTSNKC